MSEDSGRNPGKTALIVKFGQIGDVVMAVPAVYALHEQGFEIFWAAGNAVRPLLESYSWIHVIPVDDRALLVGKLLERIRPLVQFWRSVGFRRYSLCATLYYDSRYRLLVWPVFADRKVMLSRACRSELLLPARHHSNEYARILLGRDDGCEERNISPLRPDRLPPSPLPSKTAEKRVALVPGGTNNLLRQQTLRRWPVENYLQLAQILLERNWEVLLLGGKEDEWVRSSFQGIGVRDCIGALTLPEVISVCDTCDAVVSHDTGPLHLAGMSSACLLGIFGPTDPSTFLPRRTYSAAIWGGHGFACRPCYDGRDFAACQFNGCMHQVKPGLVLRELDRLLRARSNGEGNLFPVIVPDARYD